VEKVSCLSPEDIPASSPFVVHHTVFVVRSQTNHHLHPARSDDDRFIGPSHHRRFSSKRTKLVVPHFDQFDFKNQRLVRHDFDTGSSFAVGEFGGNKKLILSALLHDLEPFLPALDDTTQRKLSRLIAAIGTVELDASEGGASIVHDHSTLESGSLARAFLDDFVL
jgi:hypothetical protein